MDWVERAENQLEEDYKSGVIDQETYWEYLREIHAEAREWEEEMWEDDMYDRRQSEERWG